jgi:SAM-dependent methyltransferase
VIELDRLLDRDLPGGVGVDIGCGDGRLVQVLRAHGLDWRLVGVDPDPVEAGLAERSGQYERVHACSAARIPEPDQSFDFAFSNSVLEHIPELPPVLREAARVLRPGGAFVATVPSDRLHACLEGPGILAPALGRDRDQYLERLDQRTAHINLWGEERWRRELEAAGFDAISATPYLSCAHVRRWERLSNWTGGIAYALARRRQVPLEITRRAGIATGSPLSRALRGPAKAIALAALRDYDGGRASPTAPNSDFGCLLIEARRRPA